MQLLIISSLKSVLQYVLYRDASTCDTYHIMRWVYRCSPNFFTAILKILVKAQILWRSLYSNDPECFDRHVEANSELPDQDLHCLPFNLHVLNSFKTRNGKTTKPHCSDSRIYVITHQVFQCPFFFSFQIFSYATFMIALFHSSSILFFADRRQWHKMEETVRWSLTYTHRSVWRSCVEYLLKMFTSRYTVCLETDGETLWSATVRDIVRQGVVDILVRRPAICFGGAASP